MTKRKLQLFLVLVISHLSLNTYADGYINEYGIIFISSEDPDESPWKDKLICTPNFTSTDEKGVYQIQYIYPDQSPLTSKYLSRVKPKKQECEHSVYFPDDIEGSGTFESYYPNGKTKSQIQYEQGAMQGKLEFWHPNGLKAQESFVFHDDSSHPYKMWYSNGQLALSMKFQGENQDGFKLRWYENGQPWTAVRFEQGLMIGELKQWFRNGQLERQGQYRNGVRHGVYKSWFKNGKPEAVLTYAKGQIKEAECWNESGRMLTTKTCISQFDEEQ